MSEYQEPKECKVCLNNGNDYCFACDNGNQFKSMTNADRIRAMSGEELSEWVLWSAFRVGRTPGMVCPPNTEGMKDCPTDPCQNCWLDWLKFPVEVEE